MHFLQSLPSFKIFMKECKKICFSYFWSKMLSSALYDMLKLSKTTSPQKLFPSDYSTLYNKGEGAL